MSIVKIILLAVVFGTLAGVVTGFLLVEFSATSQNQLIKDFYETENAVHVSPHSLRGKMDKGVDDYVLVDLRSKEEYDNEHIVGAINIPAYKDKTTAAYDEVQRIVGEFSKLSKDKAVIVYCYSTPCMTGRKVGLMLAEEGIYVKHLNIGWNEWRYDWQAWNHEHEWQATDVKDYIASGPEPGKPKPKASTGVCDAVASGLGC